jgi:molybdopterin-containing oxidoreductase family membrane subunit
MSEQTTPVTSPGVDAPVIGPGHTYGSVTNKISSIVLTRKTHPMWFVGLGISFLLVMVLLYSVSYLFIKGTGIWGLNVPVGWGPVRCVKPAAVFMPLAN